MKKRLLGKTGLSVSELGLGALFISSIGGQFDESKKAVLRAIEFDVNYIDTAPSYFNSENVLGEIIGDISKPLVISTKLGGRPEPFIPQSKDCLLKSVEMSLKSLKRDYIDVLFVHEPDRPGQYDWWSDPLEFYGPVIEVLDDLKKDGVIGYTGIGGTTAYSLAKVIKSKRFDVVLTAFNYSLLWREAEWEILPAAKELNMGIIIGSPLQQGALSRRYDEEVKSGAPWLSLPRRKQYSALYRLLNESGMSLPELGLRFVLSNPDVSCVLMGPRSVNEVETNIAAVEKGPLPSELIARIDEIAAMVPFRPYDEPSNLPFMKDYKGPGPAVGVNLA